MMRTPEQIFMHECMELMTYANLVNAQGAILENDMFVVGWEHYKQFWDQILRCREAYKNCFITPEWEPPANDP